MALFKQKSEDTPSESARAAAEELLRASHESRLSDNLLRVNDRLTCENQALHHALHEVRERHEEIREELEVLCAAEHYPAVITDIERNGSVKVRLHIQGMSPVRAEVHPDIDPNDLRVGAMGHVTKARNCLLDISSQPAPWRDIGTFEQRIGDDRIIVKHQEQLTAVGLADSLREAPLAVGNRLGFDREVGLAFTRLDEGHGEHLFTETPADEFAELGGLDKTIAEIKRAIDFGFRNPAIAKRYALPRKRGILLEGPPGNGKTRIARCTANYVRQLLPDVGCRFMSLVGSEDYSMWLGGTESRLRERFAAAREAAKKGPCVVFIDEIDALGRRRGMDHSGGAPDRILSTLLGLIDDVRRTLDNVVLIGATNRADTLDPGLTRPGRLDLKLAIPPPGRVAAECILRKYLGSGLPLAADNPDALIAPLLNRLYSPRSDYAQLLRVKLSDGRQLPIAAKELVSGAILESIVRRSAEQAAVREVETASADAVTGQDLLLSLERELLSAAALLKPSNVKAYLSSIPQDATPVEVTLIAHRSDAYSRHA